MDLYNAWIKELKSTAFEIKATWQTTNPEIEATLKTDSLNDVSFSALKETRLITQAYSVIHGLEFASGTTTDPLYFKAVKSPLYDANNDLPTPVYITTTSGSGLNAHDHLGFGSDESDEMNIEVIEEIQDGNPIKSSTNKEY